MLSDESICVIYMNTVDTILMLTQFTISHIVYLCTTVYILKRMSVSYKREIFQMWNFFESARDYNKLV